MATYQSGGVRRATANTITAMQRSAENRRCPKCQRKSALRFVSNKLHFGSVCRWPGCGFERLTWRGINAPDGN